MDIEKVRVNLFDCPHCGGKGTCLVAEGGSCGTCLKDAKVKVEAKIVKCGICKGIGKVESKTDGLLSGMPFIIVMIVLFVFYLYAGINVTRPEKFEQIFPLVGSLTTMIVTFYFARK